MDGLSPLSYLAMPIVIEPKGEIDWQALLAAGTLLLIRMAGIVTFVPPFNSSWIPLRIRAVFAVAMTALLVSTVYSIPGSTLSLSMHSVLGEVAVSFGYGVMMSFLQETLFFAATMLNASFSFSLANLLDPNSKVETPVLGQFLGILQVLVLLGSGLHLSVLASFLRGLTVVPLGSAWMKATTPHSVLEMSTGIFLSGLQLATPVIAASMLVEVAVALLGKISPAFPTQVFGIPIKTLVCYVVFVGMLGLWPHWIERRFTELLDAAQRTVTG